MKVSLFLLGKMFFLCQFYLHSDESVILHIRRDREGVFKLALRSATVFMYAAFWIGPADGGAAADRFVVVVIAELQVELVVVHGFARVIDHQIVLECQLIFGGEESERFSFISYFSWSFVLCLGS